MSVVAVKDGIIAADTYSEGQDLTVGLTKLYRQGDIALGWCGHWDDGATFRDWYFAGGDRENLPKFHNREGHSPPIDFCALVLVPEGWSCWQEWMVPTLQSDYLLPYYAIGAGSQGAMVAMQMGASALEAVEACCGVVQGCRGPCQSFEIAQTAVRAVG